MSQVTVIGAGYVGLVSAAGLAHLGHDVTCVDIDSTKIAQLQAGKSPIYETGLDELIASGQASGQLRFRLGHDEATANVDFYFLCVPTPAAVDGSADASFLEAAAAALKPVIAPGAIVVNKSTVPVGSTRLVENVLGRSDIDVVSNPEFLREGSAVEDFLHPDRIVIGADSQHASARVRGLYGAVDTTFLETDPVSAELIKYAANSFLATKLSFINAVATVCESLGADVADVRQGMGLDHRIGLDYLAPGPGWGGSCFPKDTSAMVRLASDAGYDFALVRSAIETNERHLDRVAARIIDELGDVSPGSACVCLLGFAFKAGTDDTRQSPALAVADRLHAAGVGTLQAYDPVASSPVDVITELPTAIEACAGADVAVVLTEWPEFGRLDLAGVSAAMRGSTIIDTRDMIDSAAAAAAGFRLIQLGRSAS